MIYFHQNLEVLRKGKGLSQSVMGDRYGLSQSGYGRWESNTVPDLETIVDLARFFEVTVDDLLTKDLSQNTPPAMIASEPDGPVYRALPEAERSKLLRVVGEKEVELRDAEARVRAVYELVMRSARELEKVVPEEVWRPWKEELEKGLGDRMGR